MPCCRGKTVSEYTPSMDMGGYVIVINAEKVQVGHTLPPLQPGVLCWGYDSNMLSEPPEKGALRWLMRKSMHW